MRALIAVMPALIALSTTALGGDLILARPVLTVVRKGHRIQQSTRILKDGKEWACSTEIMPYYPLAERPGILDETLELKSKLSGPCDDTIAVEKAGRRGRTLRGKACATDPTARSFLAKLARTCGRAL